MREKERVGGGGSGHADIETEVGCPFLHNPTWPLTSTRRDLARWQ